MRKQIDAVKWQYDKLKLHIDLIEDTDEERGVDLSWKRSKIERILCNEVNDEYVEERIRSLLRNQVPTDTINQFNEGVRLVAHYAEQKDLNALTAARDNLNTDINHIESAIQTAKNRALSIQRSVVIPWTKSQVDAGIEVLENKDDVLHWGINNDASNDRCAEIYVYLTKPVVLHTDDGHITHHLGRFKVNVSLRKNGHTLGFEQASEETRLMSHGRGPKYYHPHVTQRHACQGTWNDILEQAYRQRDLPRFFTAVFDMLHVYNSGSPYRQLDTWHPSPKCAICGRPAPQKQFLLGRSQREIHYCNDHVDEAKRMQFNELLTMAQRNLKTPRRTHVYSL